VLLAPAKPALLVAPVVAEAVLAPEYAYMAKGVMFMPLKLTGTEAKSTSVAVPLPLTEAVEP